MATVNPFNDTQIAAAAQTTAAPAAVAPLADAAAPSLATQPIAQSPAPGGLLAQDATAATGTVQPGGLVENRVANLIDQNSPLMQRAAAKANAAANSRGLLNSSMAIGAAQGAVMDAATPIAAADAASTNQFDQQSLQHQQQTGLANAQQQNAMAAKEYETGVQNSQFNVEQANKFSLADYTANADRQTKELVATLDANTKTLVQSSASASAAFMSYMDAIQKVQTGTGTADQKTSDIQSLFRGMQDTMQVLGTIGGLKTVDGSPLSDLLQDPTMVA